MPDHDGPAASLLARAICTEVCPPDLAPLQLLILFIEPGQPVRKSLFGKFTFYSKTPGFNSHGMYYSNYFVGGYAIHGYADVPPYAASHGCIRIPIPSAKAVYAWVDLGDTIYVYH